MDSLKKKTLVGSFWVLLERFGYLGIQFVSNIVLSRLLMPEDFGVVGVLIIFTTLSNVLIDSGLSSALIQKKSVSEKDKSTVFFSNLFFAIGVYVVVYFSAPSISEYFKNPEIKDLLRVIELMVIIDAFAAIQSTTLTREMDFKALANYKIISIIIAVCISIILAYLGFGVWSLVVQYIIFSICRALLLWLRTSWSPVFTFSKQSFKFLFSYGSKLLASQGIATLYDQLLSVFIGRNFAARELGFYTQGRQLMQIPVDSLARVVNSASFPAFSILQDDREPLRRMVSQNLAVLVFLNTPLMFFLSVVAEPLVMFLFTDKWLQTVPYFRFLCIGYGVLSIIHNTSLTTLKSVGRTDYVLRLEIIKKIIGIILLFLGMYTFGIWGLMYGLALNSFIELFLNGYYLNKEIGLGSLDQIKQLLPTLMLSLLASVISIIFLKFLPVSSIIISLITTFVFFSSIYILGSCFLKLEALNLFKKVVDNILKKDK